MQRLVDELRKRASLRKLAEYKDVESMGFDAPDIDSPEHAHIRDSDRYNRYAAEADRMGDEAMWDVNTSASDVEAWRTLANRYRDDADAARRAGYDIDTEAAQRRYGVIPDKPQRQVLPEEDNVFKRMMEERFKDQMFHKRNALNDTAYARMRDVELRKVAAIRAAKGELMDMYKVKKAISMRQLALLGMLGAGIFGTSNLLGKNLDDPIRGTARDIGDIGGRIWEGLKGGFGTARGYATSEIETLRKQVNDLQKEIELKKKNREMEAAAILERQKEAIIQEAMEAHRAAYEKGRIAQEEASREFDPGERARPISSVPTFGYDPATGGVGRKTIPTYQDDVDRSIDAFRQNEFKKSMKSVDRNARRSDARMLREAEKRREAESAALRSKYSTPPPHVTREQELAKKRKQEARDEQFAEEVAAVYASDVHDLVKDQQISDIKARYEGNI